MLRTCVMCVMSATLKDSEMDLNARIANVDGRTDGQTNGKQDVCIALV